MSISYTEYLVMRAKINAKWSNDLLRRKEALRASEMYANRQDLHTQAHFKAIYKKIAKNLFAYMECTNLTQQIIDDMSIMFQNGVKIETDNKDVNEFLPDYLSSIKFNAILDHVNGQTNLLHDVGVMPIYDIATKKLFLDIMTPDRCYVRQNAMNPSEADEFYYLLNPMDDSNIPNKVNFYRKITKDWFSIVEISSDLGIEQIETDKQKNPYGFIPVIWFHDKVRVDTFWSKDGYQIINENLNINRMLSMMNLACDYQSYSTFVTRGLPKDTKLDWGPNAHVNIPVEAMLNAQGVDLGAEFVTPDAKLDQVWKIILEKMERCAGSFGISAQAFRRQSSTFTSGYQLMLSKSDIVKKNLKDQPLYIPQVIALVKLILKTLKLYEARDGIDADKLKVTVSFGSDAYEFTPTEKETVRGLKLANGTGSVIEFIMEDKNVDESTAIKLAEKYKQQNSTFKIKMELPFSKDTTKTDQKDKDNQPQN